MVISVHGLAAALQTLLGEGADKAGKEVGFSVRKRKITGAGFVQALVLGWLSRPFATLDDLAAPLDVRVQSLHQRFNARAVALLQRVLAAMLELLFQARPETIPLLRRFSEVCIEDATSIALPASLADAFPGCGGPDQTGKASLKLLAQLEAITGRVRVAGPVAGRASDHALHAEVPTPPPGSLRLVDLGFFDLERMAEDTRREVHWISRVPARLTIRVDGGPPSDLAGWLSRCKADRLDVMATLGTAALIKQWATLPRGGPLSVVSAAGAAKRVMLWADRLAEAVARGSREAIIEVLQRLKKNLDGLPKRARRARRTTRQTLFAPRFTT